MEVSTVNLQRGQFWIFNRVGFYGKGAGPGHIKSPSAWEHHIIFLVVQAFLGMLKNKTAVFLKQRSCL